MKLKIFRCCILFSFSLSSIAQTNLNFTYNCSVLETTQVSVYLNKMELLNDTVRNFENSLNVSDKETDYILSVEFENKTIGKEVLNYPFTFVGDETKIEIKVSFFKNDSFDKKKRENGRIEIIKYYESNHSLEIQYLPEKKGCEDAGCIRGPFFMLKNNSNDTIYGSYLNDFFWGTISILADSVWSREITGMLDMSWSGGSPLLPYSTTTAWVGSWGWRNELPKNRYKYTLLCTTNNNTSRGVRQYLEKDNFVWWAGIKKYYRLIYEFDVE